MADISEITQYILQKGQKEADSILAAEQKKIDAALAKTKAEVQAQCDKIITDAQLQKERTVAMAHSGAALQKAKDILKIKNEAVKSVLENVKKVLLSENDEDYLELLQKLLQRCSEEKSGEMLLCEKDKKRFGEKLEAMAKEHTLKISAENAPISGGFILRYGNIEQNCSIDAVLRDRQEELTDTIGGSLFKE